MDIDALLLEAATEVQQKDIDDTYGDDDFEQENTTNDDIKYEKPKDTLSILKQAAQTNDKDERIKIQNAFSEAAVDVVEEIAINEPTDRNKRIAAEAVLVASSNKVNDYYEDEAPKRAAPKAAPAPVVKVIESSDEENEEDDEDQVGCS
jgi:hypothetical protein